MNIFTKTKAKKVLAVATGTVVGFSMMASTASAALTEAQINQILGLLQAFDVDQTTITNVEASLRGEAPTGGSTTTGGSCTSYTFAKNLSMGDENADVMNLQKVLNMSADTQVASEGAGSPGNETSYFGSKTKAAVVKFQEKNAATILEPLDLTAGTGFVGASTRDALNSMATCSSEGGETGETGETPVVTGPVTASLNAASPMQGGLVSLQAAAPLLVVDFAGVGTVSSVSLKRSGFSNQDALTAVYLYDGNTRLTDAYTFNNAGDLVMNNLAIGVNGTRTITVRGDVMANPVATQSTIAVGLVSYTADGTATPSNVQGGMLTFVAGSLAGITDGTNTVTGTPTVDAGTANYTIWGNTLSVSTRSVYLNGATFKMIGSAPAAALSNVTLYVDGAAAATSVVGADGMIVFDTSANPMTLTTGSHTVEVRADVVGGADRSFYVSLQKAGDIALTDSVYGANVAITSFATDNGGTISVGQGTLSLTRDTSMSTDVTSSASNQTIGLYKLQAYGEDVKVMQVNVTITDTPDTGLQNVALFADGAQVGSTQTLAAAGSLLTFSLGSQLIVPAGSTVVLEVRADMLNASGASYAGTLVVDIEVPSSQAQAMSSYALTSAGSPGTFTVTAGSATATVSKSLTVTNQTVGRNEAAVHVGSFIVEAGSTEDIRVTNLNVAFSGAAGTATTGAVEVTDIANLKVSLDGGATFRPSVNPNLTSNNFPVDVTVPADGSVTVDVYVDVTAASDSETITTVLYATARGAASNIALSGSGFDSGSAVTGQTMTVGEGALATLTVITSSNTTAQYVIGPSTGVELIRYNVTATGGDTTITGLTFDITGSASGAITKLTVTGNQGGSACSKTVTGNTVTFTGCDIPVPLGYAGTDLVVTADFGTVGFSQVASGAAALANITGIDHNNGIEDISISVVDSASSPDLEDVATSSTMSLVASMPTFTVTAGDGKVRETSSEHLATVKIEAAASGKLELNTLPLTINVSGGATLVASTSGSYLVVKEGNNTLNTTITTNDNNTNAVISVAFDDPEYVNAGEYRLLEIHTAFLSVTGGDDSASLSILPASTLDWDDKDGNGTGLSGTLLRSYPTGSVTITD